MGDIILADTITSLSEITISAKQAEMQHKKDTTIINTAVYMLPQNAYLQELVKKYLVYYMMQRMGNYHIMEKSFRK